MIVFWWIHISIILIVKCIFLQYLHYSGILLKLFDYGIIQNSCDIDFQVISEHSIVLAVNLLITNWAFKVNDQAKSTVWSILCQFFDEICSLANFIFIQTVLTECVIAERQLSWCKFGLKLVRLITYHTLGCL